MIKCVEKAIKIEQKCGFRGIKFDNYSKLKKVHKTLDFKKGVFYVHLSRYHY